MRRMVLPDLAGVLAERNVEQLVKPILNPLMNSCAQRQVYGRHFARTDGVAPLCVGDLMADHALRDDAAKGLAGSPVVRVDDIFGWCHPGELSKPTIMRPLSVLMPKLFHPTSRRRLSGSPRAGLADYLSPPGDSFPSVPRFVRRWLSDSPSRQSSRDVL